MLNKEVMKPVPGLLQQVFVALFFCFLTVGGGIVSGVGIVKVMKMYAPVLVYSAPRIEMAAPIDNCPERQVLGWDYPTQKWVCWDTLEDTLRDIHNSDSYYKHLDFYMTSTRSAGSYDTTNVGLFARASGGTRSWALVTSGNTQLGDATSDTVTINGRLVVNGVDMTPKIPKSKIPKSKNTRPLSGSGTTNTRVRY